MRFTRCPRQLRTPRPTRVARGIARPLLFLLFMLATAATTARAAEPQDSSAAAPETQQQQQPAPFHAWAQTPPMGWNSWDCFGAGVTEADTLADADYIEKHLKKHGWTIVTIDIQWYEPLAHTDQYRPGPGHFPDADMLPLGAIRQWRTTRDNWTKLKRDEQVTLMTRWSIARSPLIMGGHLPKNDDFTLSLLTNDEVVAVNQRSTNNRQLFNRGAHVAWVADVPDSKDKYLALFNVAPLPRPRGATAPAAPREPAATQPATVSVPLADLGLTTPCRVRDLWTHQDLPVATETISATVNSHGAVLYRVQPHD